MSKNYSKIFVQVYLNEVKLSAIHSVPLECSGVVKGITHPNMGSPQPKNCVPHVLPDLNVGCKKVTSNKQKSKIDCFDICLPLNFETYKMHCDCYLKAK